MRWSLVVLAVILLIVGYAYVSTVNVQSPPKVVNIWKVNSICIRDTCILNFSQIRQRT